MLKTEYSDLVNNTELTIDSLKHIFDDDVDDYDFFCKCYNALDTKYNVLDQKKTRMRNEYINRYYSEFKELTSAKIVRNLKCDFINNVIVNAQVYASNTKNPYIYIKKIYS